MTNVIQPYSLSLRYTRRRKTHAPCLTFLKIVQGQDSMEKSCKSQPQLKLTGQDQLQDVVWTSPHSQQTERQFLQFKLYQYSMCSFDLHLSNPWVSQLIPTWAGRKQKKGCCLLFSPQIATFIDVSLIWILLIYMAHKLHWIMIQCFTNT